MPLPSRECQICGGRFLPICGIQRTCGPQCRAIAYRIRSRLWARKHRATPASEAARINREEAAHNREAGKAERAAWGWSPRP
jgi:hypothetical protein